MNGIFNICKPAGVTSRDVVNHVQKIVKPAKTGHAGTLDPMAEGVLVVCVGAATRLVEYVQDSAKRYRGEFILGQTSDTEDTTGDITTLENPQEPSEDEIRAVLPQFTGQIQQRPPAFSALKVKGKRAYDLARQGRTFKLATRPVEVYSLELAAYDFPRFTLDICCGKGTYVRSLGRDIAVSLGTGATMSALTRTAVGRFKIADAVQMNDITARTAGDHLLSAVEATGAMPRMTLREDEEKTISQGGFIENRLQIKDEETAAVSTDGRLVAILGPRGATQLRPLKFFPA